MSPPTVIAVSVDHAGNHPDHPGLRRRRGHARHRGRRRGRPGRELAVYFGPNHGQGLPATYSTQPCTTPNAPSVISISWGGPEDPVEQQGIEHFHEVFAAAAAIGITVCVAAGDHGTADLDADHWDGKIHVDHPSFDRWCSRCGGTQIDASGHDVVWNDSTPFDTHAAAEAAGPAAGESARSSLSPTTRRKRSCRVHLHREARPRHSRYRHERDDYFTRVDGP